MSTKRGTWTNGKRQITGKWRYIWQSERFVVELDGADPITGETRRLEVAGDTPEWGDWRLVRA